MTIGIYSITNNKTGQMYIGQGIHIEKRINEHINKGNNYMYIDRAISKHGLKNFDINIIEDFDKNTPFLNEVLNDSEVYFIQAYNTFKNPKHYNLTPGGQGTNIDFHTLDSMKEMSRAKTNTGFFRLTKYPRKQIKQGFEYRYQYYINKKRHAIVSKNLETVKNKVIKKGLPWLIINKKLAFKTIQEENSKKNTELDYRNNATGFYRVGINYVNDAKQGFRYYYSYIENKKRKGITSVDIEKLEQKVKKQGLPWYIIDKKKANKILKYEATK